MQRLLWLVVGCVIGVLVLFGGIGSSVNLTASDLDAYRPYLLKSTEAKPRPGEIKVTFLGTASLLFDDGDTQILLDGFVSRPSVLEVARGKLKTDDAVVNAVLRRVPMDRVAAIFVAHSHYDHALDVAAFSNKLKAPIYGSPSTLNIGRGGDVPEERLIRFHPGKEQKFGRFRVVVRESKHSPPIRGINDDLGETIDKPLRQPAHARDYKEGGSFDFVIHHTRGTILVRPSASYVVGELKGTRADVLFQGTGSLAHQSKDFRETFYKETVRRVRPDLFIPIHWDNFFQPLSDKLEAPARLIDPVAAAFDDLIPRLKADGVQFGLMQGFQSVMLFERPKPDR